MARIEISSVSNPYGTGELQLQGKVAMSGTLTAVTDNLNTASPLKLSTGGVQVASTLQITTNSNPYIDAEDGAGNNRFTVGRDPSSQVVNVDFASNPTGGTNMVGGIRTYTDGVNLSQVMSFRKDGNIGIGTSSPASILQVIGTTNIARFGTSTNYWKFNTNYSSDQSLEMVNQGGAGTNTYYNTKLLNETYQTKLLIGEYQNYLSFGKYDNHQMASLFNNGNFVVGSSSDLSARIGIKGSGSTSATTSLLVQNSGGNRLLEQKDNGHLYIGNTATDTGVIYVPHSPTYADRVFMRIDGGFPLFSTISNALLEISCAQFYTQGDMTLRNANTGIRGGTASNINNSSIQLSTQINAYNGTSQNDACSLVYIENRGATLQAGGSINWIKMDGVVNEAGGGGNKWCTGIYYNPTLTGGSLLANSHYCYHATSGQMMVNTTSPNASAQLQVDSTTRGFLPPRMTDAQVRAIVSPAVGLMAYNTDLDCPVFYSSAGWRKISHSAM